MRHFTEWVHAEMGAPNRPRERRWQWLAGAVAFIAVAGVAAIFVVRQLNADPAKRVSTDAPATAALFVPPLLSGTDDGGVVSYEMSVGPDTHEFFDGVDTPTFSYGGQGILGPTVEIYTDDTVSIDVTNELGEITTTHWHGADLPAAADGGPHTVIGAGETWTAEFDVVQPAATLWYHPHRKDLTAEHVYRGAAGFMIVRDDNPLAAELPQTYGVDDFPIALQDRTFDADGQLDFAINDIGRGRQMDTLTVNGVIDPYIEVPQGFVRLRLLNGSQARVYELSVEGSTLTKIASDGGYLEAPVVLDRLSIAPGDRAEIVVEVGADPVNLIDENFERVLEIRPNGQPSLGTAIPDELATIEPIASAEVDVERSFEFEEVGDGWGINGLQMDMERVDETIEFGDTERWTLTVDNGQHVFHVHQTQFLIESINGEPPPPEDAGWEDSVWINGDREVVVLARFDSYTNPDIPYMFHCHLLDHEDLGMMGQFQVLDEGG